MRKNRYRLSIVLAAFSLACGGSGVDELTTAEPEAQPDLSDHYSAVWNTGEEETDLVIEESLASFEASREAHNLNGKRLFDLERGRDHHVGLFRPGPAAHVLDVGPNGVGLDWGGLEQRCLELSYEGLRLIDIETWAEEGVRRYAGVWAPGDGPAILVPEIDTAGFLAEKNKLAASHRLADFEVLATDGELAVIGVFHPAPPGTPPETRFEIDLCWDPFIEQAHGHNGDGFRLVEFERLQLPCPGAVVDDVSTQWRWSGRWEVKTGKDWLGVDYHEEWLAHADGRLTMGAEASGLLDEPPWVPQEPGLIAEVGDELWLTDVEIHAVHIKPLSGVPEHGAPHHDAGTSGPD